MEGPKMSSSATNRKNFDFRMSKKVAELTQVVHMLFTRNHEKEVEYDALKAAYEEEIHNVLQDAKSRIHDLENRIRDLELHKHKQEEEKELHLQEECYKREKYLQSSIHELESKLKEEKNESTSSRDLLIRAQNDLENIRQVHAKEISSLKKLAEQRDKELSRLKGNLLKLERDISDKDSLLDSKGELLRTHEKLRRELEKLHETLQESEKTREEMTNRSKRFDADIKALKRELAKRSVNDRHSARTAKQPRNYTGEYNEEMESLRRELLKYKMELYNRENNFNRMFSDKQPVNTDVATAWSSRSSPYGRVNQTDAMTGGVNMRVSREKTYAGESCSEDLIELDSQRYTLSAAMGRSMRPTVAQGERLLPNLTESNRLHRLTKPRPLPKELLTGKMGAR